MAISQSQLTKLGERLKQDLTSDDLRLLDEYRRSFTEASDQVVGEIRAKLGMQPTVRSAKSTQAIVEKLKRQSIRLGQIQDIAGCRLVVDDVDQQDAVVRQLRVAFPQCQMDDRRVKPSHGYRAVHLLAKQADRWFEIQVRTRLQHSWASISEKLADRFGNEIKYGRGNPEVLETLRKMSAIVTHFEHAGPRDSINMPLTPTDFVLMHELLHGSAGADLLSADDYDSDSTEEKS